jgi:hypothetical protein
VAGGWWLVAGGWWLVAVPLLQNSKDRYAKSGGSNRDQ